jgi:hypothetical protein
MTTTPNRKFMVDQPIKFLRSYFTFQDYSTDPGTD